MATKHVVVLMLENRSFDCMLGMLYPKSETFDGLIGTEFNTWHKPDGTQLAIQVWQDEALNPQTVCIPNPDPGELFLDIQMQLRGFGANGQPDLGAPTMGGFSTTTCASRQAQWHLARAFGVSDRWHACALCQTWPNRFFLHTGTAHGYVNNSPTDFPN